MELPGSRQAASRSMAPVSLQEGAIHTAIETLEDFAKIIAALELQYRL
jgi:hypothetical protein